jgi:septal ring factor EnvC (AmiA/AmiB activator)
MHPKGSTCPPPPLPSLAEATNIRNDIDDLSNEYNSLMTKWDCSSPAVRSVLAPYKYLTRDEIQKLVDRAEALVRRLGTNYGPINPSLERAPREEYDMLKRLSESTRQNLEKVQDELATWDEDEGKSDSESRPTIAYRSLDKGNLPFHPTDEVRQLRGENTELRNRIEELEEELAEKNSLIQSLKNGKGKGRE